MSFLSYQDYLRSRFDAKIYKVALSILGASCPTRDGSISRGGCTFCDAHGSGSFFSTQEKSKDLVKQLESKLPPLRKRFGAEGFLAYLQSYTNTYGSQEQLVKIYEDLLSHKDVKGLNIGTRPDCIPTEILLELDRISKKFPDKPITIELGIQSLDDQVLDFYIRGHDSRCSLDAIHRIHTTAPALEISGHLIFGAPSEPESIGRQTALALNQTPLKGVKLHQLMVLRGSGLARQHEKAPIALLTLDQYAERIGDFINHLRPDIYIERLYAMPSDPAECLGPDWSTRRWATHNSLRDQFTELNVLQGSRLSAV